MRRGSSSGITKCRIYGTLSIVAESKEKIIEEILTRGVGSFIDPQGAFRKKLIENPAKIVIKWGVDPTRPDIHLGHAVILRKLRQFQDLGCKVIFLVGDFTSFIGDPTGKSKIRPEISQADIEANMRTYLDQVGKILRGEPEVFSWIRNSDWFISVNDIIAQDGLPVTISAGGQSVTTPPLPGNHILAKANTWVETRMQKGTITNYSIINLLSVLRRITHGRLIERDMFQDRLAKGEPIFMHEMLYPVIQGIDSNVLANIYGSCDLEVGGTDEHINMLVGRDVMEMNSKEPQAVLSFKILEGTDGKEKMSKSLDNYIAITDAPADMYGKVMSVPDTSIANYFELATYTPLADVENIKSEIAGSTVNPRDLKMRLAREIVAIYHGEAKATEAEADFVKKFQEKGIPENIPQVSVESGVLLVDILLANALVESKTEFRRLVEDGAISDLATETAVTDPAHTITADAVYKIGKKRFIKVTLK